LAEESRSFYRNIVTLVSGTAIAQLLPFIALPILQRYFYSPTEFALFFTFTKFTDMFMTSANLKLELGMVMQNTAAKRKSLIELTQKILLGFALIVALVVVIFRTDIAAFYDTPELGDYLFLVPLFMLAFGAYQLFYYWMNTNNKFKLMAMSRGVQTSSGEGGKLLFGVLNFGPLGLILGRFIGQVSAALVSWLYYQKGEEKKIKSSSAERKEQWLINKDFAYFSAPSTLIKALIAFLVIGYILKLYGKDTAGNFGASMQYLGAVLSMLSASFGQVYYNKIAQITDLKLLLSNYLSWLKKLGLIAITMILVIHIIPNDWVVSILGERWRLLLPITRIMSIWMGLSFISGALSFIYVRLGKQRVMLLFDIGQLLIALGALYIAGNFFNDLKPTLWCYTIGQSLFYIIAIFAAIYFIKSTKTIA